MVYGAIKIYGVRYYQVVIGESIKQIEILMEDWSYLIIQKENSGRIYLIAYEDGVFPHEMVEIENEHLCNYLSCYFDLLKHEYKRVITDKVVI